MPHKAVQAFRFGWGDVGGGGIGWGGVGGGGGVRVVCMSAYELELLNGLYWNRFVG